MTEIEQLLLNNLQAIKTQQNQEQKAYVQSLNALAERVETLEWYMPQLQKQCSELETVLNHCKTLLSKR